MDAEWTCTLIDDPTQQRLYERSERMWVKMTSKVSPIDWKIKEHMNWAAVYNKGCSHFGVSPELLPRSSIRFDTFHLKFEMRYHKELNDVSVIIPFEPIRRHTRCIFIQDTFKVLECIPLVLLGTFQEFQFLPRERAGSFCSQ